MCSLVCLERLLFFRSVTYVISLWWRFVAHSSRLLWKAAFQSHFRIIALLLILQFIWWDATILVPFHIAVDVSFVHFSRKWITSWNGEAQMRDPLKCEELNGSSNASDKSKKFVRVWCDGWSVVGFLFFNSLAFWFRFHHHFLLYYFCQTISFSFLLVISWFFLVLKVLFIYHLQTKVSVIYRQVASDTAKLPNWNHSWFWTPACEFRV